MEEQQQSVDSTKPGFVMPDNWHCRRVAAINGLQIWPNVRLLGWDPSGQAKRPYCVEDVQGHSLWVEHIRFDDVDTCDWSDDDKVEPC